MTIATFEAELISPENGYNLSGEEAVWLTSKVLDEQPPEGNDRFVCYKFKGDDQYASIGRYIEGTVFNDTFHNSSEEMQQEYGPYEGQSTFYVSIDRDRRLQTGVLRVIENGTAGLKSLNDFSNLHEALSIEDVCEYHGITDLDDCWDIGTVAVLPENRSAEGGVSIQLYRGIYISALEANIQHLVSIIDSKPLNKLTEYLGIPFEPLAGLEPFEYLGSKKSCAVYGYIPEFYEKANRKRWTAKGILARKVLSRLIQGTQDSELQFKNRYKK